MKKTDCFQCLNGMLILVFLGIHSGVAMAGSLQKDYSLLEQKRVALEKERINTENRVRLLLLKQKNLQVKYYRCGPDTFPESREVNKESVRKLETDLTKMQNRLSGMRIEFSGIRREMEMRRIAIEKKYRIKTKASGYEDAFRKYMEELNRKYLDRMGAELITANRSYAEKIEEYIALLKKVIASCRQKQEELKE